MVIDALSCSSSLVHRCIGTMDTVWSGMPGWQAEGNSWGILASTDCSSVVSMMRINPYVLQGLTLNHINNISHYECCGVFLKHSECCCGWKKANLIWKCDWLHPCVLPVCSSSLFDYFPRRVGVQSISNLHSSSLTLQYLLKSQTSTWISPLHPQVMVAASMGS